MKGVQMPVHILIVTAIFSAAVLGLTVSFVGNLDKSSKVESVPVVEKRIEAAIYTMSGVEKGNATLNLRGQYGLEKEDEEALINYSSKILTKQEDETERVLNTPVEFSLEEEGKSNQLCISKSEEKISLTPGEC